MHVKEDFLSFRGCRIQLRLPMGPTRIVELNSTDTLALLRDKVSEVFFPPLQSPPPSNLLLFDAYISIELCKIEYDTSVGVCI